MAKCLLLRLACRLVFARPVVQSFQFQRRNVGRISGQVSKWKFDNGKQRKFPGGITTIRLHATGASIPQIESFIDGRSINFGHFAFVTAATSLCHVAVRQRFSTVVVQAVCPGCVYESRTSSVYGTKIRSGYDHPRSRFSTRAASEMLKVRSWAENGFNNAFSAGSATCIRRGRFAIGS